MYPFQSHPSQAQAPQVQAPEANQSASSRFGHETIDPADISLEGAPPMIQVAREIGVMLLICLAIAIAGGLYAHFFVGH